MPTNLTFPRNNAAGEESSCASEVPGTGAASGARPPNGRPPRSPFPNSPRHPWSDQVGTRPAPESRQALDPLTADERRNFMIGIRNAVLLSIPIWLLIAWALLA